MMTGSALAQSSSPRVERVLTQAEQQALTPDQVLQLLKDGNRRFVSDLSRAATTLRRFEKRQADSFPKR